ncbi:hypothetical protein [Paenibacillus sp. UNC451MF]|uniref:hypothetical protein n=1 Tax=Paenibacillus sp. UNC451MF TaxID=1449063 RepID=UPI00068AA49E|nr:hypothetical protein [Paenibacillus sp. UNC451MF]
MIKVRHLQPAEYDFFMDMHYESIHIVQGKPPKDELLNAPNLRKYNEYWERKGDRAVIALIDDIPVGAAWYRLFDESNQDYGFVDVKIPELGILIQKELQTDCRDTMYSAVCSIYEAPHLLRGRIDAIRVSEGFSS